MWGTTDMEQALSNPGALPGTRPRKPWRNVGWKLVKIGSTVINFWMCISEKEVAPDCTNTANIVPDLVKSMNQPFVTNMYQKKLFQRPCYFQREYIYIYIYIHIYIYMHVYVYTYLEPVCSRKTFQQNAETFQSQKHSDRINPRCSGSWTLSSCPSCYRIWRTNMLFHRHRVVVCQNQAAVLSRKSHSMYRAKIRESWESWEIWSKNNGPPVFKKKKSPDGKTSWVFFLPSISEKKCARDQIGSMFPKFSRLKIQDLCETIWWKVVIPSWELPSWELTYPHPRCFKMIFLFPRLYMSWRLSAHRIFARRPTLNLD